MTIKRLETQNIFSNETRNNLSWIKRKTRRLHNRFVTGVCDSSYSALEEYKEEIEDLENEIEELNTTIQELEEKLDKS